MVVLILINNGKNAKAFTIMWLFVIFK